MYTDGSQKPRLGCFFNKAAYAVITAPVHSLEDRISLAKAWQQSNQSPDFAICAANLVVGQQTNNRAELAAIIVAMQQSLNAEIVLDSQYAIDTVNACILHPTLEFFIGKANLDLIAILIRLLLACQYQSLTLRKVKSHQDLDTVDDPLLLFDAKWVTQLCRHRTRKLQQREFQDHSYASMILHVR